jgi:ankyrin repeat protein
MKPNRRCPSIYLSPQIQGKVVNTIDYKYKHNHELNKFINEHYEEIMEIYCNDNDDKLEELLNNTNNLDNLNNQSITHLLVNYCIEYNNTYLFRLILSKKGTPMLFPELISDICTNNCITLFEIIFEYMSLDIAHIHTHTYISDTFIRIIFWCKDILPFLEILLKNGYIINTKFIETAILYNKLDIVRYCIDNNYDIQSAWNDTLESEISDIYGVQMLKLLWENNIDISENIDCIFENAIEQNDLDIVVFVVENFPEYNFNINSTFNKSWTSNNKNILIYLLEKGLDINRMDPRCIYLMDLSIIKLLTQYNYPFLKSGLEDRLIKHFILDSNLDNVSYLMELGADPQCIFDKEDKNKDRVNNGVRYLQDMYQIHTQCYCTIRSFLEYTVSMGKLDHIKFLANNYSNLFQPEINRLFVIAAANGQCEMATYLFDLGAVLNEKALTCACFFGHLDMVKLLLSLGMEFSTIPNLFFAILDGCDCIGKASLSYDKLVEDDLTFRNDLYNYGTEHIEVFKLLIKYEVPHGSWQFLRYLPIAFYDPIIFSYFLKGDVDPNERFMFDFIGYLYKASLLEMSIIHNKIDITELLLQYTTNISIQSVYASEIIERNENFKNLLLRYGADV